MLQTCVTVFIPLHPKLSKPKFHHYSIFPVFLHQEPGTYFPILWSVFLCCCRVQTDTSASMMISKVVAPVTLILVTSLHTLALPSVLDYSEPRSSMQVCSFPPRIILWLCWIPMGILRIDHLRGTWGINVRTRTDVVYFFVFETCKMSKPAERIKHLTITLISALIYSFSRWT